LPLALVHLSFEGSICKNKHSVRCSKYHNYRHINEQTTGLKAFYKKLYGRQFDKRTMSFLFTRF